METTARPYQKLAATPSIRRWRSHALALGCYTLLAIVVTYPLALRLNQQVIANKPGSVDAYLGVWNLWWTAHALQQGQNPFVTPLLFYPDGLDLFWQTLSLPQGLLAFPITLAAGPLVAYNVMILAGFVLGGYSAFLFVRYVVTVGSEDKAIAPLHHSRHTPQTDLAALVAGAIYALSPFHMQKVVDGQLEVASIQWVPCYLLAFHILLERRRWPWALLAALLLIWVGLGTWYYGLFCIIYTGVAAVLWAIRSDERRMQNAEQPPSKNVERRPQNAEPPLSKNVERGTQNVQWNAAQPPSKINPRSLFLILLWGLSPLLLWLLLMLPRLISLAQTGDQFLGDARGSKALSSADLAAFWLPNPLHPLWGEAVSNLYLGWYPDAILWNVSFGLVGIGLALVGILTTWRATWRWAALIVVMALLAMGSTLNLFGVRTDLPLLYALLADLPGIRASHRPNHFVILSILLVALLAAYGSLALFRRWPRRQPLMAGALIVAVLAIDGWSGPLPLFARPMPAYYATMSPPDGGAILPVPLHLNFSNSEHLWYQTVHHWPIVGGFIGREPPYPTGLYTPGIRELRFGHHEPDDILSFGWPDLARESLAAHNIRYVILHRSSGSALPLMRQYMAEMRLTPAYRDELIEVYSVLPVAQPRSLVYLGAGWGSLERDSATGTAHASDRRWRWMSDSAELRLFNPTQQPHVVELELAMESYNRPRPLYLRLDDDALGSIEVSRAAMRRTITLLLEPGAHVLYLDAESDPVPGQADRRLSIAFLGVTLRDDG